MSATTHEDPQPAAAGRARGWRQVVRAAGRIGWATARHGVAPLGVRAAWTLAREGRSDLHWKVLGDALGHALSRSGPLTTKLGQILATREDLLPPPLCRRLDALYSRQPPMAAGALDRILARAYPDGLPFELERAPLGVGSVGQVHRATLPDGRRVVVKLVRPGAAAAIERDLAAAQALIPLLVRLRADRETARFALTRALEDLARGFRLETDLENEAAALEEFRRRLRRVKHVVVPEVHRDLSREGVLVMEELVGEPLAAYRARAAEDPRAAKRVATLALREILRQVFEEGRFHADPHAGNLLVLEDGRLGLIDLGLVGELTPRARRTVTEAVRAFLARDPDRVIRALTGLGTAPEGFDPARFKDEVVAVVRAHAEVVARLKGGGQPSPGEGAAPEDPAGGLEGFVNALFAVATRHRIDIPRSTTLLVKSLVTIEGVARSLDPELNLARAALPVLLKSMRPRWLDRLAFWRRDEARGADPS